MGRGGEGGEVEIFLSSSPCKSTNLGRLESTLMASFNLKYLLKALFSKYSHMGVKTST